MDICALKITRISWKPPLTCNCWFTIHHSMGLTEPEDIAHHLAKYNLFPEEVFMDAGGTVWIPVVDETTYSLSKSAGSKS